MKKLSDSVLVAMIRECRQHGIADLERKCVDALCGDEKAMAEVAEMQDELYNLDPEG